MQIDIKAARVSAGLTQRDAAKMLGVTQASLCRWERGEREPRLSVFLRLCELYGFNPSDLFVRKK